MGLYVLAVHNPGYGGDVEAGLLRYILEYHRFKIGLIAVYEVVVLEIQYGLHSLGKGVVALLDRLYEPLCRIEFLLHEGRGLLGLPVFGRSRLQQYVRIFAVHLQFRYIEAGHIEAECPVLVVQDEVRHYLLGLVVVRIIDLTTRRRVEFGDSLDRIPEFLLAQAQTRDNLLEMPGSEFVVIIPEYGSGYLTQTAGVRFKLEQEAFAEIPRSYACRIEALYDAEHAQGLLIRSHYIGPEGHIIHYLVDRRGEVAPVVETAYEESSHLTFVLADIAIAQLVHKTLGEALFHGESVVLGSLVLPVIVDIQFVGRSVIGLVLVQRNVLGLGFLQ